jgi:hypothetical protein
MVPGQGTIKLKLNTKKDFLTRIYLNPPSNFSHKAFGSPETFSRKGFWPPEAKVDGGLRFTGRVEILIYIV